jgi:uncharacterized protein YdiU (UPF0061 family)
MTTFENLRWDDRFTRSLPGDRSLIGGSRPVRNAAWSLVQPTPVRAPELIAWSNEAGALLGIDPPKENRELVAAVLGGNRTLLGMIPFAACYGGHQFGHWADQLGDGRAIVIGELDTPNGHFEIQLKGAGPTPYSRRADGRAVLRSSIREMICSEAMFHLGVPTTRALALVSTGDSVVRDMFYDGRPQREPGAIVTRVAPTFVRFGNFELFAVRRDETLLRALADYVIQGHYPDLWDRTDRYGAMFTEVCRRTALLVAAWMDVGFVHGVLNTDNMSILGLTIDYGPYGWLDVHDPSFTPNTTDAAGRRYCFGAQPRISQWNLVQLAHALMTLSSEESLEDGLNLYQKTLGAEIERRLAGKMGISHRPADVDDAALFEEWFTILAAVETDHTIAFRQLANIPVAEGVERAGPLEEAYYAPEAVLPAHRARVSAWLEKYAARVRADSQPADTRVREMNAKNPWIVPRNYLVHEAITRAENGDPSQISALLEAFKRPFEERAEDRALAGKRPEWAREKAGCSALSCSS